MNKPDQLNETADFDDDDRATFPGDDDRPRWPQGLSARIELVYDVLGPYLEPKLADFAASILSSPAPDEEAVHWLGVAAVWDDYHRKYQRGARLSVGDERNIITALQAIAAGRAESGQLPVSGGDRRGIARPLP